MIKIKNKLSKKEYYFRFFTFEDNDHFYYTETIEPIGFDIGHILDFDILDDLSWTELLNKERNSYED